MKCIFFSFLTFLTGTSVLAQNQVPIVSNVQFTVKDTSIQRNYITQSVTITYDLLDVENEAMQVSLRVSTDYGNSFSVAPISITGDVGSGVISGKGKTITWIPSPGEQIENARRYVYRVIADDGQKVDIASILEQVDSAVIRSNFDKVYGNNHPFHEDHYANTRNLLVGHYFNNNYGVYTDNFVTNDRNHPEMLKSGKNIIGNKSGLLVDSTVMLSGHYDNVDTTLGADDNNIAVALIMEAARVLKGYQFRNNLSFANWDMEEDGLVGAAYYSSLPQSKKIKALFNFDGVGIYKTEPNSQKVPTGFNLLFPLAYQKAEADSFRGNFITLIGDNQSAVLVQQTVLAANKYMPGFRYIDLTCPDPGCTIAKDLRRSDHAPFWDKKIPSVFFTSTTEFRSDCYHKPCDTVVDFGYANRVVKLAMATMLEQAQPIHAGYSQSSLGVGLADKTGINNWNVMHPYPNPVHGTAYLKVSMPMDDNIDVKVMDMQGREVAVFFKGALQAGEHILVWHPAMELPRGMYLIQLETSDGFSYSSKVVIEPEEVGHKH